MDAKLWHSEEHVRWMCEQAGVEFKGLPLPHHDKQKLLAIIERHPPGQIPTFTKRIKEVPVNPNDTKQPITIKMDSSSHEKALLDQYSVEINKARVNQDRYSRLVREAREEEKALTKKRAMLAKALGIVEAKP